MISSPSNNIDSALRIELLPEDYKPNLDDILCGRGNVHSKREANKFFQGLILKNIDYYKKASTRFEKIQIVDSILSDVRFSGRRFLKQIRNSETNRKHWFELDGMAAHKKIGHCVRDTIRLLEKENKRGNINHSRSKNSSIAFRAQFGSRLNTLQRSQSDSDVQQNFLCTGFDDSENEESIHGNRKLSILSEMTESLSNQLSILRRYSCSNHHLRTIRCSCFEDDDRCFCDEFPENDIDFKAQDFFGEQYDDAHNDDISSGSSDCEYDDDVMDDAFINEKLMDLCKQ